MKKILFILAIVFTILGIGLCYYAVNYGTYVPFSTLCSYVQYMTTGSMCIIGAVLFVMLALIEHHYDK